MTANDVTSITNVQDVASYSWLNSEDPDVVETPKIAVPGMPGKWLARTDAPPLKPDTETRWFNQNIARCPDSPWEPGVRAVLHQQPGYDFSSLDLISDHSILAPLLEFVVDGKRFERFGAQIVGNTVIFVSLEKPERQVIETCRGFRKDFDHKYLEYLEELVGTLKHYRIISCQLGEVKIMLRYVADGYHSASVGETDSATQANDAMTGEEITIGHIIVKSAGTFIPHEALLELNTHNVKGKQDERITRKLREAWLSQSQHFIRAPIVSPFRKQNFRYKRGHVRPHDVHTKNHQEILRESGMENANVVDNFLSVVSELVSQVRMRAVETAATNFQIELAADGTSFTITQKEDIPGLSEELCSRLKGWP